MQSWGNWTRCSSVWATAPPRGWVEAHRPPRSLLIVDLSADHRLDPNWTYGLPELNFRAVHATKRIANPGCFATAIQLALLPLGALGVATREIHIHGITGSTGAGQSPSLTTHFSWRNNNVSVYKAFEHQHLAEIERSLLQAGRSVTGGLNFLPIRGAFTRGIFVTTYFDTDLSVEELRAGFRLYYADAAFTYITDQPVHLKQGREHQQGPRIHRKTRRQGPRHHRPSTICSRGLVGRPYRI